MGRFPVDTGSRIGVPRHHAAQNGNRIPGRHVPHHWQAQQRANADLEPEGLYVTHLFRELEVILTPDWVTRRVRIPLQLRLLRVFRPDTLDLILTKRARGDQADLADIEFLLACEPLTADRLRAAFARARVPQLPEIEALFTAAQPKVLALVKAQRSSTG